MKHYFFSLHHAYQVIILFSHPCNPRCSKGLKKHFPGHFPHAISRIKPAITQHFPRYFLIETNHPTHRARNLLDANTPRHPSTKLRDSIHLSRKQPLSRNHTDDLGTNTRDTNRDDRSSRQCARTPFSSRNFLESSSRPLGIAVRVLAPTIAPPKNRERQMAVAVATRAHRSFIPKWRAILAR